MYLTSFAVIALYIAQQSNFCTMKYVFHFGLDFVEGTRIMGGEIISMSGYFLLSMHVSTLFLKVRSRDMWHSLRP